tara:strand:+ start:655 stop:969 length:315 start_codon:yes stop_codon:yes gene_type:complete
MTTENELKYRNIEGQDDGAVRILDGEFKGVAISIGRISIDASGDGETATLKYDYDVMEIPKEMDADLNKNKDFDQLIGDIIVDILETKLKDNPDSLRFNENSED